MNKIIVRNNIISNYTSDSIYIAENHIIIGNDSDYMIEYTNCDDVRIEVEVKDGINANLYEYMNGNICQTNNTYTVKRNATLKINKFYNNKATKEKIVLNLEGEKAQGQYNFSSISTSQDEYNLIINHLAKQTFSNINNKVLCLKDAKVTIIVDSNLPKGNTDCQLLQESRIVTLGDNNCLIKPNMYIEEDQVEARHGSVIGGFKEEDIFYLQGRGISYNEAIKLLMKGFILANLDLKFDMLEKILESLNKEMEVTK